MAGHEGFGPDYELPNNGYFETCAAIGLVFWAHRMLQMEQDADSYKQQQLALPLKKVSQVASFRMSEIALQLQKNTYAWSASKLWILPKNKCWAGTST